VKRFIGARDKSEVIFTRNTSEGLNLLAYSLGLAPGDRVVLSDKEHNSNLVPWLQLKKRLGIVVEIVPSRTTNETDIEAWKNALSKPTKVVSLVYTSNLDGVTNPVKEIASLAHQAGAVVIVDAAQVIPHQKISVTDLDVDFLVFSVHKMCGPSGMGVLYGKKAKLEQLEPFLVGGDTVVNTTYESFEMLPLPERFEAGLQDYAGIMGTKAAIEYLIQIGMEAIQAHEIELNEQLTWGLAGMERLTIIGPKEAHKRSGICSFTVSGADHHLVAQLMDKTGGVAVRSGQHCVHSWFESRGITGSVRASVYFYNTSAEVDTFLVTLKQVLTVI
jgi:cysteine desulfurase/selenocysteine lyase